MATGFITSSLDNQVEDLSPAVRLTTMDGIIGEVLANRATEHRFAVEGFKAEYVGFTDEDFDALDPDSKHELIHDWVTGVEVEAEMEHNPICRARWDLQ